MKQFNTIIVFTLKELFRGKIFSAILFLLIFQLAVTWLAIGITYSSEDKIALDFGLSITNLAVVFLGLGLGIELIAKEIQSNTIYMILSRPVSKAIFLLGKLMAIIIILIVTDLLMGLSAFVTYKIVGGQINYLFIWEIFYVFLQGVLILNLAILLSLVTRNIIAVLACIIIYIFGNIADATLEIVYVKIGWFFELLIKSFYLVLPNFNKLNLKDYVLYENTLTNTNLWGITGYALLYTGVVLILSLGIFKKKDLI